MHYKTPVAAAAFSRHDSNWPLEIDLVSNSFTIAVLSGFRRSLDKTHPAVTTTRLDTSSPGSVVNFYALQAIASDQAIAFDFALPRGPVIP